MAKQPYFQLINNRMRLKNLNNSKGLVECVCVFYELSSQLKSILISCTVFDKMFSNLIITRHFLLTLVKGKKFFQPNAKT